MGAQVPLGLLAASGLVCGLALPFGRSPLVQRLAREHGIEQTSYEPRAEPDDCILCGLCTRVCDHIGVSAIASTNRGWGREIAPPFNEPPPDCIGCGACAYICPTDVIQMIQTPTHRVIWDRTFEMYPCKMCGKAHITKEQRDWMIEKNNLPEDYFDLCDECKRKRAERLTRSTAPPATALSSRAARRGRR